MKTKKIRLFATMVTLAAVIISTTNPAIAQRRQTQSRNTEKRVEQSNKRSSNVRTQTKSASKSSVNRSNEKKSATVQKATRNSSRSQQPDVNRQIKSSQDRNTKVSRNNNATKRQESNRVTSQRNQNKTTTRQAERSKNTSPAINSNRAGRSSAKTENNSGIRSESNKSTRDNTVRRTTGNTTRSNRETYRIDENDKRYSPNQNYRGSKQVWTETRRPSNMNYNRKEKNYYKNYDFRAQMHWDRNWERYHWNFYSWRDYYSGYNPYSYRYHRYYYRHPLYGHVIRKFVYRPNIFIYNHNRYYCYDGHFFRFFNGIGYVLVDVPFGVVFDGIPVGYERVYVNGYLYFRVGNLFFEFTNNGFQLVHYPERYYAFDEGYINEGYYFGDDLYY